MALYVTRPRRDEERIGRGLPSGYLIGGNHDAMRLEVGYSISSSSKILHCLKYAI